MADPCQSLVLSLANLEEQSARLQSAAERDSDNIWLRKQLQGVREAIVQVNALLRECRTNSQQSAPQGFALAEHNQAVQFFELPYYVYPVVGQIPPDNNKVPLVAGKQTLVRLYVDAPGVASLGGTLQLFTPAGTKSLSLLGGQTIVGQALDQIDRLDLTQTLNFLIPAGECSGALQYRIHVTDAGSGAEYSAFDGSLSFVVVPPVKIHCVLIHYTGLDFFDQKVDKTVDENGILSVLFGILAAYPISDLDFDGCEVIEWDKQMKIADHWGDLLDHLSDMRDDADSDSIYLGFVPEEANCGSVCGKGNIGGGACVFRAGATMDPLFNAVHEMGHAIGRKHAPECLPEGEDGDTDYPQYSPFVPRASIGGIGLDLRDLSASGRASAIKDPAVTRDYMSYCDAVWTSPYGYLYALNRFRAGDFADEAAPDAEELDLYSVTLRRESGRFSIASAFHLPTLRGRRAGGVATNVRALILDDDGERLCEARATSNEDDGSERPRSLRVRFPRFSQMRRLVLFEGDEEVEAFEVEEQAPEFESIAVQRSNSGSRWRKLKWKVSAPKSARPGLRFSVRYSADGRTWRALAANLGESQLLVDLSLLPGGPECRFQIIASAGLRTTIGESEKFESALEPRELYVALPVAGQCHSANQPIACAAAAFSPSFKSACSSDIHWVSPRFGYLGDGNVLTIPGLPAGRHWLEVQAPDGLGNLLTRQVMICVHEEECAGAGQERRKRRRCCS